MWFEDGLPVKGTHPQLYLKVLYHNPIESANVLEVTMRFYGGYKYRVPVRGDGTGWIVPIPFLEPDQLPSSVALGGPVCSAITTAFITQSEEVVEDMQDLCHQQDHLA